VQNRPNITNRDRAILDALVHRVRVLSVGQVARTWFGTTSDPDRFAARRVAVLEGAGLVERCDLLARPELRFGAPLARWCTGEVVPTFSQVATKLAARWREPVRQTPAVIATKTAGTRLGGVGGRRPRRSEASHDLSLAGLYLRFVAREPEVAKTWVSESGLRRFGFGNAAKLPDALVYRDGEPIIVELGGTYGAGKLREFHGFCREHGLRYELW
jgi:hypothetical protein